MRKFIRPAGAKTQSNGKSTDRQNTGNDKNQKDLPEQAKENRFLGTYLEASEGNLKRLQRYSIQGISFCPEGRYPFSPGLHRRSC